jgi:hypothetical protein
LSLLFLFGYSTIYNITMSEIMSKVFHRKLDHQPLFIDRAEGIYLYEKGTGRKIMDGCGGAAVVSVGHCVPEIVAGVSDQLSKLSYISSATFAHEVSLCKLNLTASRQRNWLTCYVRNPAWLALYSILAVAKPWSLRSRYVLYYKKLILSFAGNITSRTNNLAESISLQEKSHITARPLQVSTTYSLALITALSLGRHERRRAHFTPLFASNFHAVSPCYAYRHKQSEETDADYVARLAQELENAFQDLGPDSVAAFVMEPGKYLMPITLNFSRRCDHWLRAVRARIHEGYARCMSSARGVVCFG